MKNILTLKDVNKKYDRSNLSVKMAPENLLK